jgi:hypothetical protein
MLRDAWILAVKRGRARAMGMAFASEEALTTSPYALRDPVMPPFTR